MIGTWRQAALADQGAWLDGPDIGIIHSATAEVIEIATTVKLTQDAINAFNNADFTGTGNADWENEHVKIGLTAALKALGFEVVQ
jgi:hypothetical protein